MMLFVVVVSAKTGDIIKALATKIEMVSVFLNINFYY